MVTKNQIKRVTSLQQKKYRNQYGLFVAEGLKTVQELIDSVIETHQIYVDQELFLDVLGDSAILVNSKTMAQMSGQQNPSGVLGVFHIPRPKAKEVKDWILALDAIRDPGNLGTIIRLCDWYNIGHIVCSEDTVDCYNPKVLQATMGSIARVNISYLSLVDFFEGLDKVPIIGTFMDGDSIYQETFPERGILVMGNEANGISDAVQRKISKRVGIPQFGNPVTESLNVASASAVLLSEIRRN